eukprot:gene3825-7622_t
MLEIFGADIFRHIDWNSQSNVTVVILVTVFVLVATVCIFYLIFAPPPKPTENLFNQDSEHENDLDNNVDYDPIAEGTKIPSNDTDRSRGTTDKYRWTQSDQEIEMFVAVEKCTKGRDVLLDILSSGIVLSVSGHVLLDGDFFNEVVPSDCNWQLDDDDDKRVVWITLTKKTSTKPKDYWPCILSSDENHVGKSKSKPIDALDTEEFQRAMDQMKRKAKIRGHVHASTSGGNQGKGGAGNAAATRGIIEW